MRSIGLCHTSLSHLKLRRCHPNLSAMPTTSSSAPTPHSVSRSVFFGSRHESAARSRRSCCTTSHGVFNDRVSIYHRHRARIGQGPPRRLVSQVSHFAKSPQLPFYIGGGPGKRPEHQTRFQLTQCAHHVFVCVCVFMVLRHPDDGINQKCYVRWCSIRFAHATSELSHHEEDRDYV